MNEHQCTCGNTESFKILSHPSNLSRKAVCCQNCGNIWIVNYVIEDENENA